MAITSVESLGKREPAFADTSFYIALLSTDDAAHQRAVAESMVARTVVTTEFVLLELGNACARADDHADFLTLLIGMRSSPNITIIPLSSELLERGVRLMAQRRDKDWSLTDCVSFVVMQDLGIHHALTTDRHFEQAGFRALLT